MSSIDVCNTQKRRRRYIYFAIIIFNERRYWDSQTHCPGRHYDRGITFDEFSHYELTWESHI